jgi:hypothetical protein
MKTRLAVLLAVAVSVTAVGCTKEQTQEQVNRVPAATGEKAGTAPNAAAVQTPQTYRLTIAFNGLIGYYVDKNEHLWALLPKADLVDPAKPDLMPPGLVKEADDKHVGLAAILPAHAAYIRFRNANITTGNETVKELARGQDPDTGQPITVTGRKIMGDVSFEVAGASEPSPTNDLAHTSDSYQILKALRSHTTPPPPQPDPAKVGALDELDPLLAPGKPLDTSRVIARVEIAAGTVVDKANPCKRIRTYSYTAGIGVPCAGAKSDAVQLAEEVDVTRLVPKGKPVTVKIGSESLTVAPQKESDGLRIEVLNAAQKAIDTAVLCDLDKDPSHPLAFRWFYRLVPPQAQTDTSRHYHPCRQREPELPPICAGKRFVLTAK